MLSSIKRIKNLGVFGDYSQDPAIKAFSRYNLIYGENGSGKTTLSRLFSALNDGAHAEYPDLEFSVDAEGGSLTNGQKCNRKLRVFNSDYVDANISYLDQMLIDHPTEYHFLFKTLYTFKSDGKIATCYHIPNIARKLLETFLEFHSPSVETPYKKLEAVTFDDNKKTAIYKFTNDLSHRTGKGFDPAIVAESQKNVRFLLELIESLAPAHYQGLAKLSV